MQHILHTTATGVKIGVDKGKKSPYDFKVKYRAGKQERTPKHIHIIIDLYIKREHNESLTMRLVDHIINLIQRVQPSRNYPPCFQFFAPNSAMVYAPLDAYGEYSVEFLLAVVELIMIQEKTNYPAGVMNLNLFRRFRGKADIFSVVSAATFR